MRTFARGAIAKVAETLAARNKEAARALPDSKGGEPSKQLQTYRTEIYTYFTRPNGQTELLYSAESWVRLKLTLETAGPVAVGHSAALQPTLSGRGRLLDTGTEFEAYLPRGTRIYVISETVNRVSVTVEPIPWLEQISNEIAQGLVNVQNAITKGAVFVANAVAALRDAAEPTSSTGTQASQLPVPSGSIPRPRLTSMMRPRRMR